MVQGRGAPGTNTVNRVNLSAVCSIDALLSPTMARTTQGVHSLPVYTAREATQEYVTTTFANWHHLGA